MNKITILLALFFTCLYSFNSKYSGYWEKSNGPFGGFVSDILIHDGISYCATSAGLYKKQGSNPWEFIGLGDVSIYEIAANELYLYAGGHYGCYRYNIKTGEIQQIHTGLIQSVAITDSIVLIGSGNYPGIYISMDYGETWKESTNGIDNYDIEKIFITESKIILASASGTSGSGVFRSTDLGVTWNRIDDYQFAWNFQGICQKNNMLYGYDFENNARVYVSIDNGLTWQKKGAPADQIYAIFINSAGLFTGTNRTGVFKSTNDGTSWLRIINGLPKLDVLSLGGDDNIVYAGSYGGIYSSTDFSSWEQMNDGLTNSRINSIIKVNDKLLAATHGTGIQVSTDNGKNWQRLSSDLTEDYITDMIIIGSTIYIIAGEDYLYGYYASVCKSTNGGTSWVKKPLNHDSYGLKKIAGNNKFLVLGTDYGLFRSSDGGNSWSKILNGIDNNMNVSDVAVLDSTAIALNGTSHIYRSVDYGNSWNSKPLSGLGIGRVVNAINKDYYIGTGSISEMYKSSDYGESWSRLYGVPLTNSSIQDIAGEGNRIYAATSGQGVFCSSDKGINWRKVNLNLEVKDVLSIYSMNDVLLAGTAGGGILKFISADEPIQFESPASNTINKNSIMFKWHKLSIADKYRFQFSDSYAFENTVIDTITESTSFKVNNLQYDNIYYYRISTVNEFWDDDFTSTYSIKIELPLTIQLDQNFPNPFNSKTTIRYHLPERSKIELTIFDITGRKISTLLNTVMDAGSHTYVYENSSLASGIYFYQAGNKGKTVTKKFVLIK